MPLLVVQWPGRWPRPTQSRPAGCVTTSRRRVTTPPLAKHQSC
uniref:Uncharacterized protein n=1 Tax=Arundo donax TaxID=35708 RepID=A0A0A8Z994_ARUDO